MCLFCLATTLLNRRGTIVAISQTRKRGFFILASMYEVLTLQFEHHMMTKDILEAIKEMFVSIPDINKQKILEDLLNTKMPYGGSVVNLVLKLMEYIYEF